MKRAKTTFVILFALLSVLLTGCVDDKLEIPESPCINIAKSEVLTGEEVIIRVCSDADLFTFWPGDEGHEYANYGQDNGFSFSTDTFVYVYDTPGNYNGTIVAVNQKNRFAKTAVSEYTITVTETSATFNYFAYEEVFPPVTGEIEEDSIFLTVPFKTDLTNMVMNFDAGFAKVSVGDSIQESGVTPNDFSSPVTYQIESWDGKKTNEYVVEINKVAPKSEKELFDFGLMNMEDSTYIDHDENIIYITVPFDASINSVIAEFSVSESATVKVDGEVQESGKTSNNFLKDVQYSIIAEDGSKNIYDVNITKKPSPKNNFIYFAFSDPLVVGEYDNDNRTIVVEVPEGTDLSSITPIISTSKGSTVYVGDEEQVSGESVVNFTNTVYYIVKAENGDLAVYTVTVKYI